MRRGAIVIAFLGVFLMACGADDPPAVGGEPVAPAPGEPTTTAAGPAEPSDPPVRVTVAEAPDTDDGVLLVRGQVIRRGEGAATTYELCGALTRSIPPSCVGVGLSLIDVTGLEFVTAPSSTVSWTRPVELMVEKVGPAFVFRGVVL